MTREELLAAYHRTDYCVGPLDEDGTEDVLRLGESVPYLETFPDDAPTPPPGTGRRVPGDWAMITAYNPTFERPGREVNEARQAQLIERITELGYGFWPAHSIGEDDGFEEPMLLVRDIPESMARQLAREFRQLAILVGHRGDPPRLVALDAP